MFRISRKYNTENYEFITKSVDDKEFKTRVEAQYYLMALLETDVKEQNLAKEEFELKPDGYVNHRTGYELKIEEI